jgi:hypothetical protein
MRFSSLRAQVDHPFPDQGLERSRKGLHLPRRRDYPLSLLLFLENDFRQLGHCDLFVCHPQRNFGVLQIPIQPIAARIGFCAGSLAIDHPNTLENVLFHCLWGCWIPPKRRISERSNRTQPRIFRIEIDPWLIARSTVRMETPRIPAASRFEIRRSPVNSFIL